MRDLDKVVGQRTEQARNIFDFFGYAITTVTWISFCIVTVAILTNFASDILAAQTMSEGRRGLKVVWLLVIFVGFVAVASSAVVMWSLFRVLEDLHMDLDKIQNRFVKWAVRNSSGYILYGSLWLVVIIAGTLSFQALDALGLLR